jgi:hypothetical protein
LVSSLAIFSSSFFCFSSSFFFSASISFCVLGLSEFEGGVDGLGVGIGVSCVLGLSEFEGGVDVGDSVDDGELTACVTCPEFDESSSFAQMSGIVIVSTAHFNTSQPAHIVISLIHSPTLPRSVYFATVSAQRGLVIAFHRLSHRHFPSTLFFTNFPVANAP